MQLLLIYSLLGAAAASSVLGGSLTTVRKHGQVLKARQATTTTSAALSITSSAFNAFATNNVGVYYGHSETEDDPSMYPLCNNEDIDIVIMGFLRQFNGLNELPIFDLGPTCESDGSTAGSAITCPELATNISLCQSVGKKVFLSIGGSSSNITFNTSSQATQAAQTLWDAFGAGSDNTTTRPFGNVTLDGFDFDIESGSSTDNLDVFTAALQAHFAASSPTRYISAAPLCANNTAFPHGFYENTNFVWPRFYNAQACGMGSAGFNDSVLQWHDYLESVSSNIGSSSSSSSSDSYPRLYVGALSFDNNVSGYVAPDEFAAEVLAIRANVSRVFGGVTLWEGSDALVTTDASGRDFLNVSKVALDTVVSGAGRGSQLFGCFGVLSGAALIHVLVSQL